MKKIKKVMATLLAAALVLGSTMTAFAAETTESQSDLKTKPLPVYLSYSRDDAGGSGTGGDEGDDSKRDIINIELAYDNLNFEYKADSIVWDPVAKDYIVTLNATSFEKGIKITNNSNIKIGVTPGIDNTGAEGIPVGYRFDFTRVGETDQAIVSADNLYGASNMQVSKLGDYEKVLGMTNTNNVDTLKARLGMREHTGGNNGLIDSSVESFSQKVTTITLAFRAASTNVSNDDSGQTGSGGSHTGGESVN